MWGSVAIYSISWLFGGDIWQVPLTASGVTSGSFLEAVLYIGAFSSLPMVFYNIYRSYKEKTGKMRSFKECFRPLVPLVAFFLISILWAHTSPNKIVETDPRIVYLLTGTIFSNIACRLIVSQMSSTQCETFHFMTPVLCVFYVISLMFPRLERVIVYGLTIFSSLSHWHYGTIVVQQMCERFNRVCFGVGKRVEEPKTD